MKSYLSGNPELKLAINEDLVIGSSSGLGAVGSASVILDDCNFHECADLSEFEDQRILSLNPPDGEFAVMNYRITSDFRVPFRIFPFLEETNPYKLELTIKVGIRLGFWEVGSVAMGRLWELPSPRTRGSGRLQLPRGLE